MIEAMLSLALIGSGMAWKAKVDNNYQTDERVRGVVDTVDSFVYGMDKRVLLDGTTWTGGEFSADNAKESYKLIKNALVGVDDSSCSGGGWSAAYSENSKMSLMNCYAMNPYNMPFGLDMSTNATQVAKSNSSDVSTPENSLKKFSVTLFYKNNEDFDKHLNVFLKLYKYAKVMNSPRITGSHKYMLIDRDSGKQITISECTSIKSRCGFSAEYVTNEAGESESPYLMVNGDNFMIDNLKFQDSNNPTTAMNCTIVDDAGGEKSVPCGFNTTGVTLDEVSTKSFNKGFYLVDGDPAIQIGCHDDAGTPKSCGMVVVGNKGVLRINTVDTDSLKSQTIEFSQKLSSVNDKFNVDASSGNIQGNDIWGTGNIHSKVSVFADRDRYGNSHTAELDSNGLRQKGNFQNHVNILSNGAVEVNSGNIMLNGSIARTNAASRDNDYTTLDQYVTKRFLAKFNAIGGARYDAATGVYYNIPARCLGNQSPHPMFIPHEIPVRSVSSDEARCQNKFGARLAMWKAYLKDEGKGTPTARYRDLRRVLHLEGTVGCSLSRDSWVTWEVHKGGSGWHQSRYRASMNFIDYGVNGRNIRVLPVQAKGDVLLICPKI
ncbi:hypothetical protein [Photobacterium damselae]|uniref:hypothetical protein n=1 Tax=Photobacterium damselae TaxID=38293 RepID=UPI004068DD5B